MNALKGVKRLIAIDTAPYLTVSLYLNVDGRQYPKREYESELKDLIRHAMEDLKPYPEDVQRAARQDLERVERYVREEFVRGDARLLVVFSCEPARLFEVFAYSISMKSRLVLYPKGPYVTPLLIALAGYADTLAVMTNREMARGFFYQAGRLEEIGQVRQEVPAQVRYGGFKGYEEKRISRHIEEHVQWHLKRTAEAARGWFELYQPDLVLLMGLPELTFALTRWLPPEMTQRLGPSIDYFVEAGGLKEIQARIEQTVIQYERQRMERWVDQLLRSVPHKAVVGVEPTLESLNEWRCAALVFDPDEAIPGVQCPHCGYLDLRSERCPRCGQALKPIPDVVVEAVELAVQQGADLYPVRHDSSLLDRIHRMGAFLRF